MQDASHERFNVPGAKEFPPFNPDALTTPKTEPAVKSEAMVVVTCRLPRKTRDSLTELYRTDPAFNSMSHIIQVAVEQFLERQKESR